MSVNYKDYYDILGVSRSASAKEIKSAFKKLAKKYHPDVSSDSGDKFKEINEAYEVLGDESKRKRYDQLGANWKQGQSFNPEDFGFGGGHQYTGGSFGSAGFSDFFDILFGQMGAGGAQFQYDFGGGADPFGGAYAGQRGARSRQQQRPAQKINLNVEQSLYLDLEDLIGGVKKQVTISHSGKKLSVNIPRGVREGGKIRLSGEGKQAGGSQKGDVHLVVRFNKHKHFEFEGDRLVYPAKLHPEDFVLGGEIKVPTLEKSVTLTIPAGAQPGKLMRLKGQGLPEKSGQGDLYVRLGVKIPEVPTATEKTLYEELRKSRD